LKRDLKRDLKGDLAACENWSSILAAHEFPIRLFEIGILIDFLDIDQGDLCKCVGAFKEDALRGPHER